MPGLSGATRLAAVIGDPARHSLSPAIHNAAFAACDLDWTYLAFDVPEGRAVAALDAMRTFGLGGLSVTMPHKTAVAAAVDTRSEAADRLEAVNCVVPTEQGLHGENTDGDGFIAGLGADAGIEPNDVDALVIGGGGAARAVVEALARHGAASVAVHNRSPQRAEGAARLAGERGRTVGLAELDQYTLIVNATPIGMVGVGDRDAVPCPVDSLGAHQVLIDLVYEPARTEWLRQADARGVEGHNGLSMLVHQAAAAFTLWTGVPAPIGAMTQAASTALAAR
ncbi:MAG: shikimate dehydrogenase [Acidimicrobiia bacterium]|nr:shikimate dehydrogenase [Acidimicrobiia bacterium]